MVKEASRGHLDVPWPAQLNRLVWEGGHDLVLSIGQVRVALVGAVGDVSVAFVTPRFSDVMRGEALRRLRKRGVGGLYIGRYAWLESMVGLVNTVVGRSERFRQVSY